MSKIQYIYKNLREDTLSIIEMANTIVLDYQCQGFDLTLRQLYYQFVSRDWLPKSWIDPETGSTNNEKSYKKLGDMISNGRLNGLIDWNSITDRTRKINTFPSWKSVSEILRSVKDSFSLDKWEDQRKMVEVWVEKDALVSVVEKACRYYEVPFFSCRGYVSQSAMWRSAMRIQDYYKPTTILHLGDHDPSGIDMTRDIIDRLKMFGTDNVVVERIALTPAQIEKYNPPPNPTKITDTRAKKYIEDHGHSCWELDALEPAMLVDLIVKNIEPQIEFDNLNEVRQKEDEEKEKLEDITDSLEQ